MNFIVVGLTLAGAALPQIVVASDCKNADPTQLTADYAAISLATLPNYYLRWYFASGLSVGVLSMSIPRCLLTKVHSNCCINLSNIPSVFLESGELRFV
jgi:hypothetical protein